MNLVALQKEFPELSVRVGGRPVVYLDSAATSLKPQRVLTCLNDFYCTGVANVHRGAHFLSAQATERFESARRQVADFIGAESMDEVVFTRGTTESINLVAHSLGESLLRAGDRVLLTLMEHHSNIVPWDFLRKRLDVALDFVSVTPEGELDLEDFRRKIPGAKVFAFTHQSNVLGTLNPVRDLVSWARAEGAITVVDAAQSVVAHEVTVSELDCDFLAFSGHKVFGPFGVGVLYGKKPWFEKLPPYQGGGSMIQEVRPEGVTYLSGPHRFEAGTPAVAEAIALGEALQFCASLDRTAVKRHEQNLVARAQEGVMSLPGSIVFGTSPTRTNILSFYFEDLHASDLAQLLDEQGVAVRAGHHCCQPLLANFGLKAVLRASFSVYNTEEEVDVLLSALKKAMEILR